MKFAIINPNDFSFLEKITWYNWGFFKIYLFDFMYVNILPVYRYVYNVCMCVCMLDILEMEL